jgi:hypothetical protein
MAEGAKGGRISIKKLKAGLTAVLASTGGQ